MIKTSGNRIKVGIFIVGAIALFVTGIYFIGQGQQMFSKTFHLCCVFKDISGLQIGNNVRFSGINVGVVTNIEQITDSAVRVDILINEATKRFIKSNAKAVIGSDGLLGNRIIQIVPGANSNSRIANNDTILTIQPVSIDEIMQNIKVASDHTAEITGDLSVIMDNIKRGKGTVGKLFSDSVFADNLNQTLVNIKQGAGGFKNNMDAASHNFFLKGFFKKKKGKDKQH